MAVTELIEYIKHLAVVSKNGWALQEVPEELQTKEICLAAILNNGRALGWVPEELYDREISLAAVTTVGL